MKTLARVATPIALLLLTSASALAENSKPSSPPPSAAQNCTPFTNKGTGPNAKGAPLGEKLAENKGVLCPPKSQDSDIQVPPPDTGAKMPVIEPPGNAK